MQFTHLNELQMPTWRQLRINETDLSTGLDLSTPYGNEVLLRVPEGAQILPGADVRSLPGLPPDMERQRADVSARHNHALTLVLPAGLRLSEPVFLEYTLDAASPVLIDLLHIRAEAGSRADIVLCYRSGEETPCFHQGFTLLEAAEGADVRLFRAQLLGAASASLDTTALRVGKEARGDALLCEMGAGQVVSGCDLALLERGGQGTLGSLYLGGGESRQDLNYRLEVRGPSAQGEILVKGALTGSARKTLKSTLDFISGASGAKGREEETVLALSDRVVNLSAPLLLCGEENVEGEHATTTGRPDPGKLFYLMSRGFSELEAKRLLIEAAFTPLLSRIPAQGLRAELLSRMREVSRHG